MTPIELDAPDREMRTRLAPVNDADEARSCALDE
jgi:hypothetical protein